MATVNYTTYSDAQEVALGPVDGPIDMTSTGTTQQSAAFGTTVRRIEIVADAAIRYALGLDPDVDANTGHLLPANVIIYKPVEGGWKLAVKNA